MKYVEILTLLLDLIKGVQDMNNKLSTKRFITLSGIAMTFGIGVVIFALAALLNASMPLLMKLF